MFKKRVIWAVTVSIAVSFVSNGYAASGRDYISVVGSSTVYPFATTVAE